MTKHLWAYNVDRKSLTSTQPQIKNYGQLMVLVLGVVYLIKSLKSSTVNRTIKNIFKILLYFYCLKVFLYKYVFI